MHDVHLLEVTLNPHPLGHELQFVPEKLLHGLHSPVEFPNGVTQPNPGQHVLVELHPAIGLWHEVFTHWLPQQVSPAPVLHSQPIPLSKTIPVDALLSQSLQPSRQVPSKGAEIAAALHNPPKHTSLELLVLQSQSPSKLQSEYPSLHAVHSGLISSGGIRHSHLSVQQPDWHPNWSFEHPCSWSQGLDPEGQHNCLSLSQHNLDWSSYDIPSPQLEQGHMMQNLHNSPNKRASTRAPRIPNSASLFSPSIRIE